MLPGQYRDSLARGSMPHEFARCILSQDLPSADGTEDESVCTSSYLSYSSTTRLLYSHAIDHGLRSKVPDKCVSICYSSERRGALISSAGSGHNG